MTDIVIIIGPTASGKSELALSLARKLNGVIVNADSMQVYKEIPIITSSPTILDKEETEHYLYNHISIFTIPVNYDGNTYGINPITPLAQQKLPSSYKRYSVAQYLDEARATIKAVWSRGKVPIIVGGTGMYIKALMYGIHFIPSIDDNIKSEVERVYQNCSLPEFYQKLINRDPLAGEHIHPTDSQRMMRAYEVVLQTNKSLFYYHTLEVVPPFAEYKIKKILLMPERKFLYQRCNDRLIQLVANGVLDEIANIKPYYEYVNSSAKKALGVQEMMLYITGKMSLDQAICNTQIKTRQYAKRQYTWFQHQTRSVDQVLSYSDELGLKNIIRYANIN